MAALSIQVPYPVFYDRDGQPLDNGNIYIGVANLDPVTNPLTVYYDEALTITASQPLVTSGGYVYRNGTPTQLYVNANDFSITVNDSKNLLVYNFPEGTGLGVGAANVEYDPPFTGAVTSGYSVADKLEQTVSVKDFGAVCDGVADDTAAVQAAVDYCASLAPYWPTLIIPGRCKLVNSVNIDRLVDTTKTEFRIVGEGPGAGFYGTGTVTFFDSTIAMGTGPLAAPVSEAVTFENINFEASSLSDECFVISRKFLRIKFLNCYFFKARCIISDTYVQTLYFLSCNMQQTKTNFVNCIGLYDVTFDSCIIERGATIVRSIDLVRGTNGLRFINNLIEGMPTTSLVVAAGVNGFDLIGNHLEANYSPEFSFFAGGPVNGSVNAVGNYIYNPSGATFYYGPTTKVFSSGNTAFPSVLHSNANQVAELISCADNCRDINGNQIAPSDATVESIVNGVYRAGTAASVWSDNANQITKDVNGNFAINATPEGTIKLTVKGADQSSGGYAAAFADSAGLTIALFRNDRNIAFPALQNYANDAAAAAGGVPVGYLYRNGSVVQVRVT